MIGIHSIHRRMAELAMKAKIVGGYTKLSISEQVEINHLMTANADLVYRLDGLKALSFLAHESNDMEWVQDLCRQIDELEVKMT